jgi:Ca2+-transporting ATPase
MLRPPRDPSMPILTAPLIVRIFMVSLLLVIGAFGLFKLELVLTGGNEALARTLAVNVFVFGEMFYLFNCRSMTHPVWTLGLFSNPLLWVGVGIMIIMQLIYTYLPVFNTIFQSAPMGFKEWGLVLTNSSLIFILVEIEKKISRKRSEVNR